MHKANKEWKKRWTEKCMRHPLTHKLYEFTFVNFDWSWEFYAFYDFLFSFFFPYIIDVLFFFRLYAQQWLLTLAYEWKPKISLPMEKCGVEKCFIRTEIGSEQTWWEERRGIIVSLSLRSNQAMICFRINFEDICQIIFKLINFQTRF